VRWLWIDNFAEFESGVRATAVKNVTTAEEHVHDSFPGYPVMPASLMIEGMAQTAGILVGEARQFTENVILAKIRRAEFDDYALPGDQLKYEARIESIDEMAAMTTGVIYKNDRQIGQVDLLFSHVGKSGAALGLPDWNFVFSDDFVNLLRTFQLRGTGGVIKV
jgi:3-hydroxyacyl-[acyl-carrier-protein] dehydratase